MQAEALLHYRKPEVFPMSFLIILAALIFLMLAAYRGHSVILFAPVAALGAINRSLEASR